MMLDEPFPVVAGQVYTFELTGETTLSRSCPGSAAYPDGRPLLGSSPFSGSGDEDLTFGVNIIGPNEREFPSEGGTPVTVHAVEFQANDRVAIYPNPATNHVSIQLPVKVEVLDLTGRFRQVG